MRGRIPAVAGGRRHKCTTRDDEMSMEMFLHGLPPGVQDHREADLATQILVSEFLQELRSGVDEELEEDFLIEAHEWVEDMIDGEDDMKVVDGEQPFLLLFQPLGFLEGTALGTMSVFAGFVVELQLLTYRTFLHHTAHGRRATLQDRIHHFRLLIRKTMCASILAQMFAEDLSHVVLHPGLLY